MTSSTWLRPRALPVTRVMSILDALVGLGSPVVMSSLPEFRAMRALPHPLRSAVHGYGRVVSGAQRHDASRRSAVRLVDVRGAVGREFVHDPSTMSADSIHPSATGYGRIADAMAPTVLAVLRWRARRCRRCATGGYLRLMG